MPTNVVRDQLSELRWLVYELGQEVDALATTPYPLVHRFLIRNLTTRIIKVTAQVHGVCCPSQRQTRVYRPMERVSLSNPPNL